MATTTDPLTTKCGEPVRLKIDLKLPKVTGTVLKVALCPFSEKRLPLRGKFWLDFFGCFSLAFFALSFSLYLSRSFQAPFPSDRPGIMAPLAPCVNATVE